MIDGMKVSDPFAGEFDFGTLIADEVARVEVLRGEQSALYGSDAIGGVIHYITLTGAEAPGIRARVEGGSFGTANTALRVAGVDGRPRLCVQRRLQSHRRNDRQCRRRARAAFRDLGRERQAHLLLRAEFPRQGAGALQQSCGPMRTSRISTSRPGRPTATRSTATVTSRRRHGTVLPALEFEGARRTLEKLPDGPVRRS